MWVRQSNVQLILRFKHLFLAREKVLINMAILANITSLLKNIHSRTCFSKREEALCQHNQVRRKRMTDTKYHVRFTGRLKNGSSREDVIDNLVKLTTLGREKVQALLSSQQPLVLKKNLNLETAQKYQKVFEKAGMIIQILQAGATQQAQPEKPGAASVQPPKMPTSPAAPGAMARSGKSKVENPYAAPKSDVKVPKENKKGLWCDEPQKVPVSHGWYWLKSALSMFIEQPWMWMGMWLVVIVMTGILSIVPFIGPFCGFILMVVLNGGLMLAAFAQTKGEKVTIGHVFQGFSKNTGQLILVGIFYLLFILSIGIVFGGIIFGVVFSDFHTANMANFPMVLQRHIPMIILFSLLSLLLTIPLVMSYWFAPSLVALTDKTAWNAYKISFTGCRKNWVPFLVYGLTLLVAGILLMLVVSALMGILFVFVSQGGSFLAFFIPMILYAVIGIPLTSIMGLSIFTGFKDIYYQAA